MYAAYVEDFTDFVEVTLDGKSYYIGADHHKAEQIVKVIRTVLDDHGLSGVISIHPFPGSMSFPGSVSWPPNSEGV